jgi:hypothetical protein
MKFACKKCVVFDEIGWADSENESYWLSRIPLIVLVMRLGSRYRAENFFGSLISMRLAHDI